MQRSRVSPELKCLGLNMLVYVCKEPPISVADLFLAPKKSPTASMRLSWSLIQAMMPQIGLAATDAELQLYCLHQRSGRYSRLQAQTPDPNYPHQWACNGESHQHFPLRMLNCKSSTRTVRTSSSAPLPDLLIMSLRSTIFGSLAIVWSNCQKGDQQRTAGFAAVWSFLQLMHQFCSQVRKTFFGLLSDVTD